MFLLFRRASYKVADVNFYANKGLLLPLLLLLLLLPQNVITVTTVLPHLVYRITVKFSSSSGNYRGYRGIAAFPVTASSSDVNLSRPSADQNIYRTAENRGLNRISTKGGMID